jgi:hypothetical protein
MGDVWRRSFELQRPRNISLAATMRPGHGFRTRPPSRCASRIASSIRPNGSAKSIWRTRSANSRVASLSVRLETDRKMNKTLYENDWCGPDLPGVRSEVGASTTRI